VTATAAASFSTPAWREDRDPWSKAISLAEARTTPKRRAGPGRLALLLLLLSLRRRRKREEEEAQVLGMVAMVARLGFPSERWRWRRLL
jgi:hypothetical protein